MSPDETRLMVLAELAEAGMSAASLVHEVRQPLFALRAMAQLGLEAGSMGPERITELLAVLTHLDDVLAAWGEVGRREEPRLYDLSEGIDEVVRLLASRARQLGVRLDVEDSGSLWAEGSPSAARQVVLNLVQNALDAVATSPVRQVTVRSIDEAGLVGVEVDDTGPGISAEDRSRLFEPFFTTKGRSGTGLGLWVARRICVEAGGSLALLERAVGTRARAQFASSAGESSVAPALAASAGPMKKA